MNKLLLNQVPVYCLHIRKYRETSLILQCFSESHGCFDLVGKGLYRAKNKNDLPEYFQPYRLSGICRNELGTLTGLELIKVNNKLFGQAWLTACYANELLIKFLPRLEPVPELYASYVSLLADLHSAQEHRLSLLWFEKRLLEVLGYGINFHYEYRGDASIENDQWYEYNVTQGFRLSEAGVNQALPGHIIQAMAEDSWPHHENQYFALAKRIIRSALKYQLGDAALRTVSVSKDLQQFIQHDQERD